jgi:hypothetical protein
MKRLVIFLLVITSTAWGQHKGRRALASQGYFTSGFYVQLGYTEGPTFANFFEYLERKFQVSEDIGEYGGNVSVNIGYLSRFSRNFALDVGFSIYGLNKTVDFANNDGSQPEARVRHELNYQSAIFSGTVPIILEFDPRQPVIPYVGMGLSIFSLRLDNFRDAFFADQSRFSEALRDTRTAVGGHFEAGLGLKITRRLWLDLRGRWHTGSSHLTTLEEFPADFDIKQTISQYSFGFDYFFR